MRRVVVGVDGSQHGREALAFAVREARAHGAEIDAVHAWHVPVSSWMVPPDYAWPQLSAEDLQGRAHAILESEIATVVPDESEIRLNRIVVNGLPAHVLAEAAQGADLLVVGARGLGGFSGMLLGSVSHYLIKHAPCPMVIVRHEAAPDEAAPEHTYVSLT